MIRSLDPTPQRNEGFKLKITITADLKELKMSITTANGLKPMNIFKNEQHEMSKEKYFFLMDGLISRGVLEKVEYLEKPEETSESSLFLQVFCLLKAIACWLCLCSKCFLIIRPACFTYFKNSIMKSTEKLRPSNRG